MSTFQRFSGACSVLVFPLVLFLAQTPPHQAAMAARVSDTPPYAASEQNREAAERAFADVGELLARASELSGLPIRSKVKSSVTSRGEVEKYITQRMKDTADVKRERLQELALKKFGFIPPDYPLHSSVVQLLTEQAAAYYDPRAKQIFIADWTPIDLQRPAIVHELTHALQDQQVNLDAFLDDKKLNDDEQMARAAVVEGQGALVMMKYVLAAAGMTMDMMPNIDDVLAKATLAEVERFPVFAKAPMYLRDTLVFPYTAGMQYARFKADKDGGNAFASMLANPPSSTAEILHPGETPAGKLESIRVPEPGPAPPGFSLLGEGVLGELDIQILLKQYAGAETARQVAPGWSGLRYAIYENGKTGASFLVHRSRWKNAEAAAQFVVAYRKVLEGKHQRQAKITTEGDTVTVFEGVPEGKAGSRE